MTIRAVVFDFDGLILDTEGAIFHSWCEAWAERGVELTVDEWAHCIGTVNGFDPEAELVRRTGGRPLTPIEAQRRRQRRDEILAAETVLPGVAEHITEAIDRGLGVAIASSSSRDWVVPHLARFQLDRHFRHIACYEPAGPLRPKPAPDLYVDVLDQLRVPPDAAVAYEDSAHGVAAATAAGVRCVAVPGPLTRHLDFSAANLVVGSLADITLEEVIAALEP